MIITGTQGISSSKESSFLLLVEVDKTDLIAALGGKQSSPVTGLKTTLPNGREVRIAPLVDRLQIVYYGVKGEVVWVERTHDAVKLADGSVVSLIEEGDPRITRAIEDKKPFGFLAYVKQEK